MPYGVRTFFFRRGVTRASWWSLGLILDPENVASPDGTSSYSTWEPMVLKSCAHEGNPRINPTLTRPNIAGRQRINRPQDACQQGRGRASGGGGVRRAGIEEAN